MNTLKGVSRIAVGLVALSLIATYFVPVWRIDLWAPQYPEGLVMKIWLTKLTGNVEIINGLNHYIGMAHIREEMFPEFIFLPYIIGGYIAFGLLTALTGSRALLIGYLSALVLFGMGALYDFWQWGYQYGHNLDPTAPIQVPGMSYQPPLIGYKQLLNFGAYSMPDAGGWVIAGAGLIIATVTTYELFLRNRKGHPTVSGQLVVKTGLGVLLLTMGACTVDTEPVNYGHEDCHYCRMTIVEKRFAAELVTAKGKAVKFDDVTCLLRYMRENKLSEPDFKFVVVNNYNKPGEWTDARQAVYLHSPDFRSPMRGDLAAFADRASADALRPTFPGATRLTWPQINQQTE